MGDPKVFVYKSVLSADIVVERDFGEGVGVGCVGWGGGLAISEEGGDDYEELEVVRERRLSSNGRS